MSESYGLTFHHVSKVYGTNQVVRDLDFSIKAGERLILLGPSGCGKTTTLRMIAGLESITSGDLYMGDRRMNDVAPGDRNIAMVFQSYALYLHMTVWDNITFCLQIQKLSPSEADVHTDVLQWVGHRLRVPEPQAEKLRLHAKVILGIRSEKCRFSADPMLPAKKIYEEDLGSHWITYLQDPNGDKFQVSSPTPMPQDAVGIDFAWENACFFDGETEVLL